MKKNGFLSRFIGDRQFYRNALSIAIPIMIQMGITNLVTLIDNLMVGNLGTESISGVSIVNQFVFIFILVTFGAVSAAGIFTAQFYGKGDVEGVRATFRFKMITNLIVGILCTVVFAVFSDALINAFLYQAEDGADLELAFSEAKNYLKYAVIGLIPYSISCVYASTLKETNHAVLPMIAGVCAVFTNCVLNVILIFGVDEIVPAMGVEGAALATTISRFVELLILVIYTHSNSERCPFIKGAYKSFFIPKALVANITTKGMPLLVNELLWSSAVTVRNQAYASRGMNALAASSISTTIFNVFSVLYMSVGTSISILVGNKLGRGDMEGAKDTARKMLTFSICASLFISVLVVSTSGIIPNLFDVTSEAKALTTYMLVVHAVLIPVYAFCHGAYFTIRSGGRMIITFLLDAGFMWSFVVPLAKILANFTGMSIHLLFPIIQATEIIKVIISAILLKKINWTNKLVD